MKKQLFTLLMLLSATIAMAQYRITTDNGTFSIQDLANTNDYGTPYPKEKIFGHQISATKVSVKIEGVTYNPKLLVKNQGIEYTDFRDGNNADATFASAAAVDAWFKQNTGFKTSAGGSADGVVSNVTLSGSTLDFTGSNGGFNGGVDLSGLGGYTIDELKIALANTENDGASLKYYVDPVNGLDTNNGTKETPFKTIAKLKQSFIDYATLRGSLPTSNQGAIYGYLFPGTYNESIDLTSLNSGLEDNPIVYKSVIPRKSLKANSTVSFEKGLTVPFSAVKNAPQGIIDQVPSALQSRLKMIDIADLSLTTSDVGDFTYWSGNGSITNPADYNPTTSIIEQGRLYINKQKLDFATYPSKGSNGEKNYLEMETVVNAGFSPRYNTGSGLPIFTTGDAVIPTLTYNGYEQVYGYFTTDFVYGRIPIEDYDLANDEITLKYPAHYSVSQGDRYFIYNSLGVMANDFDMVYDSANGYYYFIAPTDFDDTYKIEISLNTTPLVNLDGVDNIRFEGIDFKNNRGNVVVSDSSDNVVFDKSNIYNSESDGFSLIDGYKNIVKNSYLKNIGDNPIILTSGDKFTQKSGDSYLFNIVSENFGNAIRLDGVGTKLLKFELYNTDGIGVSMAGTHLEVAYGKFFDVSKDVSDFGYIYGGRNPSETNWKIHDIYFGETTNTSTGTGTQGIYIDDKSGFVDIYNILSNGSFAGSNNSILKVNQGVNVTMSNSIAMNGDKLGWYNLDNDWTDYWTDTAIIAKLDAVDGNNSSSNWTRQNSIASALIGTVSPDYKTNVIKNSLHIGTGNMYQGLLDGSNIIPEITNINTSQSQVEIFPNLSENDLYLTETQWKSEPSLSNLDYIDFNKLGVIDIDKSDEKYISNFLVQSKSSYEFSEINGTIDTDKVTGLDTEINKIKYLLNDNFGSQKVPVVDFTDTFESLDLTRYNFSNSNGTAFTIIDNQLNVTADAAVTVVNQLSTFKTYEEFELTFMVNQITNSGLAHRFNVQGDNGWIGLANRPGNTDLKWAMASNMSNSDTDGVGGLDRFLTQTTDVYPYAKYTYVDGNLKMSVSTDNAVFEEVYNLDIDLGGSIKFVFEIQNKVAQSAKSVSIDNLSIKEFLPISNDFNLLSTFNKEGDTLTINKPIIKNSLGVTISKTVGTTAQRPTTPNIGDEHFDTTLGYRIDFNGTNWVDGTGTVR